MDATATHLYAVQETAPGTLNAYDLDTTNGTVSLINSVGAAGDIPCHVVVQNDCIYASNYSSRGVTVVKLLKDGSLSDEPAAVVEPGSHAHQAVLSSDGATAYTPFLGSDAVFVWSVDAHTGALSPHPISPKVCFAAGAGPRHMVLDAPRRAAYVINELDLTVAAVAYDPSTGALGPSPMAVVSSLPPGTQRTPAMSGAHICVSPNGDFIYASNRCGPASSIAIIRVDIGEGGAARGLVPLAWQDDAGAMHTPRDFCLSPDGDWAVVANQGSDSVSVFKRDAGTGLLSKCSSSGVAAGTKPCCCLWIDRR